MIKYALVRDGIKVEEFRWLDENQVVATHKKAADGGPLLRPVIEEEKPVFKPELEALRTRIDIEKERVVIRHTVERLTIDAQKLAVKTEAQKRIYQRIPQWKQNNLTARGVELQDIWRENGTWTPEEQAEADAIKALWAWVKEVRTASDVIEALDPIPHDYAADERWPE